MLTSIEKIKVGMYVLYQNLINIVTSINKHKDYYQLNMNSICLQNIVIKLTLANNSQLDIINPDCKEYNVDKWINDKNFSLSNNDFSITHNINTDVSEIIYKLVSKKPVTVKICVYNDIEGMVIN